jgi:hypothetical protein
LLQSPLDGQVRVTESRVPQATLEVRQVGLKMRDELTELSPLQGLQGPRLVPLRRLELP